MTRRIAPLVPLALLAFAAAGCAERRYPWPDFQVSDDAWVPLPVPPRAAPVASPVVSPDPLPAVPPSWVRPTAAGFRS